MYIVAAISLCLVLIKAEFLNTNQTKVNDTHQDAKPKVLRRILNGKPAGETRPYMVYLRAAQGVESKITESDWLCSGVIIHERYILTSAACIEDVKNFYVVSGLNKWYPFSEKTDECINNGAKKAVWKCVPKEYFFDGDEFDNIRWMVGDIAVVKVEDNFNFQRKIRGCDYIPKKVFYNNQSIDLEKGGTVGSLAGWGTVDRFTTEVTERINNSRDLLETDTVILSKKTCLKSWDPRYHFVINDYMICTRDNDDEETMSAICLEREVSCKELEYSRENEEPEQDRRRMIIVPSDLEVDTAAHLDSRRKGQRVTSGGFCENDHGGPLIVGRGQSSVVVGVMSACRTKQITKKCYGPYLYTSVYKYRHLIACAIEKELEPTCKMLLRTTKTRMVETLFDWSQHSYGPADSKRSRNLRSNQKDEPSSVKVLPDEDTADFK